MIKNLHLLVGLPLLYTRLKLTSPHSEKEQQLTLYITLASLAGKLFGPCTVMGKVGVGGGKAEEDVVNRAQAHHGRC